MRRLIRDASSVFIIAGLLMLIDAGLTLVWQEPVTAVIGAIQRDGINQRYLSFRSVPLSSTERTALQGLTTIDQQIAFLARREASTVPVGAAVGRIEIPSIGADFEVVQGTDTASLERGPGHYLSTAFPGLGQTVAIAGHRTTYLAPFRNVNQLHRGDQIVLQMPYATFIYSVQGTRIVTPESWWITDDVGYERLVLSACNPLYSAAQRIVVFARVAKIVPNMKALEQARSSGSPA
jgi:sortase A